MSNQELAGSELHRGCWIKPRTDEQLWNWLFFFFPVSNVFLSLLLVLVLGFPRHTRCGHASVTKHMTVHMCVPMHLTSGRRNSSFSTGLWRRWTRASVSQIFLEFVQPRSDIHRMSRSFWIAKFNIFRDETFPLRAVFSHINYTQCV